MSIPTIPYMQFLHSELHLQEILHTSQTSHIYPTSATLTLTGKNVTQQNPVMCNLHEFSTITYPWRSIPPPQKCLYLECLKPKPYQVVPHSIPQPRTSPCREGATKWKKKPLVKCVSITLLSSTSIIWSTFYSKCTWRKRWYRAKSWFKIPGHCSCLWGTLSSQTPNRGARRTRKRRFLISSL